MLWRDRFDVLYFEICASTLLIPLVCCNGNLNCNSVHQYSYVIKVMVNIVRTASSLVKLKLSRS